MASLTKELLFMILKFLREHNFEETAHTFERESGLFFDIMYFETLVFNGEWEEAEKYLSGFTQLHDNMMSTRIYFELRKQKFLEALDRNDRAKAVEIVMKEFKVFFRYNQNLSKEATLLLTVDDFRQYESLSTYGDAPTERKFIMDVLRRIILSNPAFHGKMHLPTGNNNPSLQRLIMQEEAGPSNARGGVAFPKKN